MKSLHLNISLALAAAITITSCKPGIDVPAPQKGSIDLTNYVAIGSSMTAGYADNALYAGAQETAYPNLIANQLKALNGKSFKQPMVPASSVGIGSTLDARLALMPVADCGGAVSLMPKAISAEGDINIFMTSVAASGPFHNMGVPGVKATTLVYPGYGNPANGQGMYNPFFTRMTANPASASVLSDAAAQNPTFFTLAIGMDDVMAYAIAGGSADAITPSAGGAGFGFDASIDATIGTLTAQGAKGVVANIPHVTALPYFTTVPFNGLMLDEGNAAGLNAAYGQLGMSFHAGNNAFIIEDAAAPAGFRQVLSSELILLSVPQDSIKCRGWGSMKPIPAQYVLTTDELSQIEDAVTAYNNKLSSAAAAANLAFFDMHAFLQGMKTGMMYKGAYVHGGFVTGGMFSLDGINFTPRGNALIANEFIKAANKKYGASIHEVDASRYKGVTFP